MRKAGDYLPRRATGMVLDALGDTRVVVVNGARQVGKSTLAEMVVRQTPGAIARFLDDPVTRAAAEEDPARFVRHDGLMLIDEVQRVPDLWLAIKHLVDREPTPGRFLLTGSARLLSLRSLPDTLPGRSETIELWPLSQGELDDAPDGFVDAAFAVGADVRAASTDLRRSDYIDRVVRGGFPDAVRRDTPRRRDRYFAAYVDDMITRDVQQVAHIEQASDMRRLLALLAAQVGGVLNVSRLSSDLTITAPTVRNHIELLETIFLVRRIPAWSSHALRRATGAAKVTFVDSGLGWTLASGAMSQPSIGGHLEGFVLGELARQLTWSRVPAQLFHYRDRDGVEVDAVIEDNAGSIIGVEVKAAETARADDFRGLRILRDRLGERFRAGFVLYCGSESLSFGDKLTCLPISALWTTAA